MNLFWKKISIRQILLMGLVFRLLAAFFSEGYAFHDDHFEVIELVQKWQEGISFNWMGEKYYAFSLLYPGLHYLLFTLCRSVGINDPQDMMLVTRLFHALISLLTVYYSYLLTLRLTGNVNTSKLVALLMAVFWLFPFFSVRNLREFFCIPFLMMSFYHASAKTASPVSRPLLLAAFFFALAVCIRLQVLIFPAVAGFFWLFGKRTWKQALSFGICFFLFLLLTQGLFDFILYGDVLASTLSYFHYNSNPANIAGYPQGPWYMYILTMAGICFVVPFIPLAIGYFYSPKLSGQTLLLMVTTLAFFIFHSWYSNKQERFILPFVPFFLMAGTAGYLEWYKKQAEKKWIQIFTKTVLIWFFLLNAIALTVLCFTYTKRSRVETMNYLRKKGDVVNLVLESGSETPPPLPLFYLGKQIPYFTFTSAETTESLQSKVSNPAIPSPNYLILYGNRHFEERLQRLKLIFPELKEEKEIRPGRIDELVYRINPEHNQNETMYIFRIR